MIGIYKIENLNNGKVYIGQSNNIERRKIEHFNNNNYSSSEIDKAIQKEGIDNFSFEIIEECPIEILDEREKFWILKYDSFYYGYNNTKGGQYFSGGRPLLTAEEVKEIRIAYNNHQQRDKVYLKYADKISKSGFYHVWDGSRWKDIMPEVYTEENKKFYQMVGRFKSCEDSRFAKLSNDEVIKIRTRYMTETAKDIWQDYKDKYTLGSFKQILTGVKYKDLPVYKKQEKRWINV